MSRRTTHLLYSERSLHPEGYIPKIPRQYYRRSLPFFLKYIKRYPIDVQRKLLHVRKRSKILREKWRVARIEGRSITQPKLSDLQRLQVIELAAKLYAPKQIMRIIKEKFGVPSYSTKALNSLLRKNRELILQKRRGYLENIDTLRLVHEKARIEELSEMFEEAKETGNDKLRLESLKEIRQEVKGDKLILDHNVTGEINLSVKESLYRNVDVKSLFQLALLRVMERHHIDFDKLASRMAVTSDVRDPETGVRIPDRKLPVKVGDVYYGTDKEIKHKKEQLKEELKTNPEVIKKRLLARLKEQMEENKRAQGIGEEGEETQEEEENEKPRKKKKS
jgi:hypothetical protein